MPSVLQDWVIELPLMMQGRMMTGIRGPDEAYCPEMKPVIRWIRSVVLVSGNPENDFAQIDDKQLPAVEDFEHELEYLTVHYYRHFLHTLEIIGYKHPDFAVSDIAMEYYLRLVDWMHLAPESHEEINERLSGKPGTTGGSREWIPQGRKVAVNNLKKEIKELEKKKKEVLPPVHRNFGARLS
jgi:hypothetical protein